MRSLERRLNERQNDKNGASEIQPVQRFIFTINSRPACPSVLMGSNSLIGGEGMFLIDTGAEISVLKKSVLNEEFEIDTNTIYELSGITTSIVKTLGVTTIDLGGIPCKVHLVDDAFPIKQDGIIGVEFLRQNKSQLCFENDKLIINRNEINLLDCANFTKIVFPARSKVLVELPVLNHELREGYLERLNLGPDIYVGETLVNTNDKKCKVFAINTSEADITVSMPPVTLQEFERPCDYELNDIKENEKEPTSIVKNRVEKLKNLVNMKNLNKEERDSVLKILNDFSHQFYLPGDKLGYMKSVKHKIRTKTDTPINIRQYRNPQALKGEIDKQIQKLIENDVIEPSVSPYNAPLWIVPKQPDANGNKRWRIVIDYRALNSVTVNDIYPLPHITEILDQLGNAKYFTTLDLASGFYQILMDPEDAPKTAFSTATHRYQFKRLPMGLQGSPSTFVRALTAIFSGLQSIDLFIYMDDLIIFSSSLREHMIKIRKVMNRLRSANIQLQPDKCKFFQKEILYLGHFISDKGVQPDPNKIKAVKDFPVPKTDKNIKQFLGLVGYYRRFIRDFAKIAKPLTTILKKGNPFKWGEAQQNAFDTLRTILCGEPILQYPDFDKPFVVTTDASSYALGAILSQGEIGKDLPIAYASRTLSKAEEKYSVTEKELLAIIYGVRQFRPYIFGRKFILVTDHRPLVWLKNCKDPSSRLMRWKIHLNDYDFEIQYKPGRVNSNVDALSRNPIRELTFPIENEDKSMIIPDRQEEEKEEKGIYMMVYNIFLKNQPTNVCSGERPEMMEEVKGGRPEKEKGKYEEENMEEVAKLEEKETVHEEKIKQYAEIKHEETHAERNKKESIEGVLPEHTVTVQTEKSQPAFDKTISKSEQHGNPDLVTPSIYELTVIKASLAGFINFSKEPLYMRSDNIIHFMSTDCVINNVVGKDLLRKNLFNTRELKERLEKDQGPDVGEVWVTRMKIKRIFHLFIKEKCGDALLCQNVRLALINLKSLLEKFHISSISLAKFNNLIDPIYWIPTITFVQKYFCENMIKVTICTGEVRIPEPEDRENIIRENHESLSGGHKGILKTCERIKENFTWKDLKKDVKQYIQFCEDCQKKKLVRRKIRQPMLITTTPMKAFERVDLDLVGPLPRTPRGNHHILTWQCNLTKYSGAIALSNTESRDIVKAFIEDFICRFGCPDSIVTDQGANLISKMVMDFAKIFKIRQFKATAFHPQTMGSLERSHHVLMEYLKYYTVMTDWDEYLKFAMFSYNTSVHESTGFAPHELIFGKNAKIPSEFENEKVGRTYEMMVDDLIDKLSISRAKAIVYLNLAKEKSKRYYDTKLNIANFEIGDMVYLYNDMDKNKRFHKLYDQYKGPYKIIEKLSNYNIRIEIKPGVFKTVHANKLKLAFTKLM